MYDEWPEGWSKVHDRYFCPEHKAQAAVELKKELTRYEKHKDVISSEERDGLVFYKSTYLGDFARVPRNVVEEMKHV